MRITSIYSDTHKVPYKTRRTTAYCLKTVCIGGRKMVRNALYMATLTATSFDPKIKVFYERLINRGKPFKVAINACMHKLLRILNARMRDYLASLEQTEESRPQTA